MGLDLSLSGFIGAGGGLSYVLVAILLAASHGHTRLRLLLAGLLGSQGLSYALMSLTTPDTTGPASAAATIGVALVFVFGALTAAFAAALAVALARETSRRAAWLVGGALNVLALMGAAFLAQGGITPGKGDPTAMPPEVRYIYAIVLVGYAACVVAALAMALHWKTRGWRSTGTIAFVVVLVPLPSLVSGAARSTPELLLGVFAIACVLGWAPPWRAKDARTTRNVLLALLAWALAIQLLRLVPQFADFSGNSFGPLEVVGALSLALALAKQRAWDLHAPHFALRRGPLAAAALATLFIVAQIAENFLDARYGVLVGGVVAGALLFAANPIQRAIESTRSPSVNGPPTPAGASDDAREAAYRKAIRLALRDRALTREEELHLHEIAEQLGIGGRRAHAILAEVERELEVEPR